MYLDEVLFVQGWVFGLSHGIEEKVVNEFLLCMLIGITHLSQHHQCKATVCTRKRQLVSEDSAMTHCTCHSKSSLCALRHAGSQADQGEATE